MSVLDIPVFLGSVRRGRRSPVVARWLHRRLGSRAGLETELIDLLELQLPVMEERLRMRDDPPSGLEGLSARIDRADGLVIVTPEYNSGIPGSVKNALDYLLPEFQRLPVGVATVSAGGFGGVSCLAQLRLVLLSMGAVPVPASLTVARVQDAFGEDGEPTDDRFVSRADLFLDEVVWWAEAARDRRASGA
jgi:NAD(P)H-dependent FMN reductase